MGRQKFQLERNKLVRINPLVIGTLFSAFSMHSSLEMSHFIEISLQRCHHQIPHHSFLIKAKPLCAAINALSVTYSEGIFNAMLTMPFSYSRALERGLIFRICLSSSVKYFALLWKCLIIGMNTTVNSFP